MQSAWQETVAGTPPDLADARVENEWSLAQTLRHLVLATDAWLRGGILRVQQPFHEIGQIFTGADEMASTCRSSAWTRRPTRRSSRSVPNDSLVTYFLATATAGCSRRNARTHGRR